MKEGSVPGTKGTFPTLGVVGWRMEPLKISRMGLRPALLGALAIAFGLTTLGAWSASAGDQLTGVVMTEEGRPLEGAKVEAWGPDGMLAVRITPSDGGFSFPDDVANRTTRLKVSRLGYTGRTRTVEPGAGHYEFRLVEEAIQLRGLVIEAKGDICLRAGDREARRFWEAARRRYHGPLDTVGIATYLSITDSVLTMEEIGPLGFPQVMADQRGSSSQLRFSRTRQVREEGYAFRVRRTEEGRSFDSWSYPPLQADFAPHFVDAVFGELHEFHIKEEYRDGWVLAFCPKSNNSKKPSIRGSMLVTPDTTFAWVEWLFQTPEPDERAGGRIFFREVEGPPSETFPLPAESLFWRRLPDGRFHEVHLRFEEWIVAPGDTVPFLPKRK